ncbi:heterokaryon incompatibility protein-domain-containing protein [Halenospora varia]|nr:heterokaryon incompatibility protein-domain-containing protein [Halenospora varia]
MSICSDCAKFFQEPCDRQAHFDSWARLVESAKVCAMCALLLKSVPEEMIRQIMGHINTGSYTRLAVLDRSNAGESNIMGRGSIKCLEITTRTKCFTAEDFALLTPEAKYPSRAIWSLQGSILFDTRAAVVHEWIDQCSRMHIKCRKRNPGYLPTRLINVSNSSTSTLYLEDSRHSVQANGPVKYAALSHRWGQAKPSVMLTKASVHQWQRGINLQTLPKTFLDAVIITRKLDIPYLWIDCMCILQDDSGDWQHEASMMASVYCNAHITIAASSSDDSTGGCCIDEPLSSMISKFSIPALDGSLQHVFIRSPLRRPDLLKDSPLHERGWILQEQILSMRTVFFTEDQMIWQCRETMLGEDGIYSWYGQRRTKALAEYNFRGNGNPSLIWWRWIEDYSSRQLTDPSDRLAALAGITRLYQEETQHTPLAGLWKESILKDILWYTKEATYSPMLPNSPRHKFPSWSWASLEPGPIETNKMDFVSHVDATYVDSEIVWSRESLTSSLLKARITLRGRLFEMKDQLNLQNPDRNCPVEDHYPRRPSDVGQSLPWPMRAFSGELTGSYEESPSDSPSTHPLFRRPRFLTLANYSESSTQDETRHQHKCLIQAVHGRSNVNFDRIIEPGTRIFGLLVGTSSFKEEMILLLTPTKEGLYRRVGIATHDHTQLMRQYCTIHGWLSDEPVAGDICRKMCSHPEYLYHRVLGCFQGVEPETITII